MKVKLRHLFWRWFGQPDVPPQDYPIKPIFNEYTEKFYYAKHQEYTLEYRLNPSLENIAKFHNITRERVRQCLWKSYWRHYNKQ